jgi:hypothetical protein
MLKQVQHDGPINLSASNSEIRATVRTFAAAAGAYAAAPFDFRRREV